MARAPAKKPPARKGASRNNKPAPRKSGGVPGWLWLLLGLAVGIFVAFLWHLWELRKEAAARHAETPSALVAPESGKDAAGKGKDKAPANTPASPANGKGEEPRFDFYTLLPNQEAMPGKKPLPPVPPATPAPPANAAAGTPAEPAFILQAGSFKSEEEADKRRASILMLGMPVKIIKVPVKPGETWFRVVVGPFAGKAAAQTARSSLRSNGVDTLVLKQG
jgi:cell division protein FtsN